MKYIFSSVLMFLFINAFSQGNLDYRGENISKGVIKVNNEIKGEDFIYDEWNKGMLVLNDSIFSKQDYLKYDAFNNRVLIKTLDEIIEIKDNSLTAFSILEKGKNLKHDFVKLDKNNFLDGGEDGFYEIVFNNYNTNYFLKRTSKIIFDPNRSKGSQTVNNLPLKYQDKITYYIKNDKGLYVNVKLMKKNIIAVLNKNSQLINSYVKANKINFRKANDVMKLANYYYSL